MTFKEAYTLRGACSNAKEAFEEKHKKDTKYLKGICGDPLWEPVPAYNNTSTEKILKNDNNAWIVLGRDRPSGPCSGYGGRGDTQAAAIDIVVGRMGADVVACIDDQRVYAEPDFNKDAARIYISQKTDIDANFRLAEGSVGSSPGISESSLYVSREKWHPSKGKPTPRSAIALKADDVRLIAREGIKLVTGVDATNSQGGSERSVVGIDLIAGNDDEDLQPMVLGDNLWQALSDLVTQVDWLAGAVNTLLEHQTSFNKAVANHVHISPFYGKDTLPSNVCQVACGKTMLDHFGQTKRGIAAIKSNLSFLQLTYLEESGDMYINSRSNNLN